MKGYSELKRLAENATPGEWSHEQDNLYFYEDGCTRHMMELSEGSDIGYVEQKHNSDFIAAANPEVILELIDEIESLKKDAARYRWLRKQNWFDSDIAVVRSPNESIKIGYDCPSTERLDDYIDNEMKESKI